MKCARCDEETFVSDKVIIMPRGEEVPLCSKCVELIVREWIIKKRHFEQLKTS